jgi:hypothetical protein
MKLKTYANFGSTTVLSPAGKTLYHMMKDMYMFSESSAQWPTHFLR